jgi:hypothetical protein
MLAKKFFFGGKVNAPLDQTLQAVIDFADANSITRPTGLTLSALNRYIIKDKQFGNFATNDVFLNFIYNNDALADFSRICWKRLILVDVYVATYSATLGFVAGSPEVPNVNAYIDLKWNAVTNGINYVANSAHFQAVTTRSNATGSVTGLENNNARNNLALANAMNACRLNSTNQMATAFDFRGIGFKCASRLSSAGLEVQNRDVQEYRAQTQNSLISDNQVLFRSGTTYGPNTMGMFSLGGGLTTTQMSARRQNLKDYYNEIGLTTLANSI